MRYILVLLLSLLISCQQKHPDAVKEGLSPSSKYTNKTASAHNADLLSKRPLQKNSIKDGAPLNPRSTPYKVVNPVSEPMSRYGNPDEYCVDGEHYQVMKSAHGYRARGLASWYGTKFHKKRTSSGEPYDLYGMTAAHKTLPLPTYVKVTNLKNGREAVVKVNDRGPFHKDRIIDLSYGVADQLGFLSTGTAPVEIEVLTPDNSKLRDVNYYLQAGAFAEEQKAQSLLKTIAKLTSSPLFIEQYNNYFIVKAGPFPDKKTSDQLKSILAKSGLSSFSMLQ